MPQSTPCRCRHASLPAGHDHCGPPPEDKWAQTTIDREGDAATWGLTPEMMEAMLTAPPPPVVALQTRLAALYPEYVIAHMVRLSPWVGRGVRCRGEKGPEARLANYITYMACHATLSRSPATRWRTGRRAG